MKRARHYIGKQKRISRCLSLLLCGILCMGMLIPFTALALDVNGDTQGIHNVSECTDECALDSCACSCHTEELSDPVEEPVQGEEDTLPENALEEEEQVPVYKTVPFTDAAPFKDGVEVMSVFNTFSNDRVENAGVETIKTVTRNSEGIYTLRLESWVTGQTTTTTTTTTTPVDIVLVLDQSGSMAYDFDGDSTSTNSDRRQYAMKQAVNNFIDNVAEKYDAATSDHRIAIVTFGSSASNLCGWTYVNAAGASSLHTSVNGLPNSPSGATNAGAGMANAAALMGSGYNYNGTNTTRQKVVIMFTDGVPTTSSDFSKSVANTAITNAKTLKDNGATIYSIGIFNGANVDQLHGDKWDYTLYDDIPCSGNPGSYWGGSWGANLFGNLDFAVVDVPAANRFLNYLSSNFAGATGIGITKDDDYNPGSHFLAGGEGWRIDANAVRTGSGYYLTAANAEGLNEIFETISENVTSGGATIELDETTVMQDKLSDYFRLPNGANASSITIKTADCTSFNGDTPNWTNEHVVTDLTVNVTNGDTVSVTGFDFSDHYVGKDTNTGIVHPGKKLIMEFTIQPRDGFLGGNQVPTNKGNASFIKKGDEVFEEFVTPQTFVLIEEVTVDAPDKNVYLLGDLSADILKEGVTASCGGVALDLDAENFGLQSWQNAYVDITPAYKDAEDQDLGNLNDLTQDTTYSAAVSVTPKYTGTNPATDTAVGKSGNDSGNIYVFKPQLTFKDYEVIFGSNAPSQHWYTSYNYVTTVWLHGTTNSTSVEMLGTVPELIKEYTPDATKLSSGKIAAIADIPVAVDVKIGETSVKDHVTFVHQPCNGLCTWDEEQTLTGDPAFLLHVPTTTLTVSKTVAGNFGNIEIPFTFTLEASNNGVSALPFITTTHVGYDAGSGSFTLTHGDSITLSNVPKGVTVKATESGAEEYVTTYKVDTGASVGGKMAAVENIQAPHTISFTNTRNVVVDTGIILDSLPYVAILLVVAVGTVFMFLRFRHRYDD